MTTAQVPSREQIAGDTDERTTYAAVPVSTLLCGKILPFSLFMNIGDSYILYRDTNLCFEPMHKHHLEDEAVHTLFVRGTDLEMYYAHLEQNIVNLLEGRGLGEEESVVRYYHTARMAARRFLTTPASLRSAGTARQVVSVTVDRLDDQESLLATISRIMEPVPDLYAHSLHTCLYGLALARIVGLEDRNQLADFGVGLLLHDVGKLRLPLERFEKPDALTPEDWTLMHRHPMLGVEFAGNNPYVGTIARDVILHHHERLDGSGYPHGTGGSDLSHFARIAAVVNAFDRRTTDSCHRTAAQGAVVLRTMIVEGKHLYDSRLLASFVRLMAG